MNYITRPEGAEGNYSKRYLAHKDNIIRWRKNNADRWREYNRNYQRKLRKDPERMEEIRDRSNLRSYLKGVWRKSYKLEVKLGMTREQLMQREGCKNMEEWKKFLKSHEADHIVTASWFRKPENKHLRPYAYRAYNLQFIPRTENRNKHCWIDLEDSRVKLIIEMMRMEYMVNQMDSSFEHNDKVEKQGRLVARLKKAVKKQYL